MERERVQCDQEAVAGFYDELEAVREDVPEEFIHNVDESGCSAWAEKQEEYRVLVPATYESDSIFVPR
jgi:hypothetical protein